MLELVCAIAGLVVGFALGMLVTLAIIATATMRNA